MKKDRENENEDNDNDARFAPPSISQAMQADSKSDYLPQNAKLQIENLT